MAKVPAILPTGAVAVFVALLACSLTTAMVTPKPNDDAERKDFWFAEGRKEIRKALDVRQNLRRAKNVIIFMGDGMGISTVTAARIYKAQNLGMGRRSERTLLRFEEFPFVALSKTYSADRQTSASASTAVALLSGVKSNFGTVGFDSRVKRGNCSFVNDTSSRVDTILDWCQAAGMSVGLVSNTRVTHASPAALYAHSPDRNWERDSDKCVPDIATQLLVDNSNFTVVLGGGRRNFRNETRSDGKDLLQDWLTTKQAEGKKARYVNNAQELRNADLSDTDHLLGLFAESHLEFELSRNDDIEPSLAEMTGKALEILKKNNKGFFLFVEGGRIDHGHHDNWAKRALSETVALDEAVVKALEMTDAQDTLVVVTADHSHPFNIVGYPSRGNDILGLVDIVDPGQETVDKMPYTTLVYGNGPGPGRSKNLTGLDTTADDFQYQRVVPFKDEWETHSGEDVGIYAQGPMAHLFHGVHEQSYIAHAIAYAACVGADVSHCTNPPNPDQCTAGATGVKGVGGKWGFLVSNVLMLLGSVLFARV